ncbi:MAG: hypothetical protein HC767_00570 [Akkermansiaceae bacterium]|nr:hypothetical protein [Akkermansiaceae bacterium]
MTYFTIHLANHGQKILIGFALFVVTAIGGIVGIALLKSPNYRVERSLVIAAPPEKTLPLRR